MALNPKQPSFHILVCLIKIWTPKSAINITEEPDEAMFLTEVENIEIDESYRKLIGTASVKFPPGTIVKKTITQENKDQVAESSALTASLEDTGVLITTRSSSRKAELGDFKVGNRIKIWLGYTTDPAVADSFKMTSKNSIHLSKNKAVRDEYISGDKRCLTLMFNGYITKCSIDYPIEIKCENLASALKKVACPDQTYKNVTVNDMLSEDGGKKYKCKLLNKTGLKLHPYTKSCNINVGDISLNSYLTVADVLTEWAKYKVFAFIKDEGGTPYIAVGRSYFSNAGKDSVIKLNDEESQPKQILFDYHVAENGLTLMNTDKSFLAVEATCLDKDDKFYHITIRRNPDWDESKSTKDKWQVLNEVTISKKARKMGATVLGKSKDKVDLSTYTIIPYMSKTLKISHDELLDEAIKYFESYNMNGIEGSLTLFGDLALKTGAKVELVDKLHPQKNGYYLVDEVHTTFGVGGYRQRIKLPYCIAHIKPDSNEQK